MGRSTVAAFKESAEKVGASSLGEVFAPLDTKDYSQYFGQIRAAQPQVLYTSVAGNDTVRLFTQMQEFGLLKNLTVLGASGTVTVAEHRRHRQGRRRLHHRRRLFGGDRYPGQQDFRRRIQGGDQGRARSLRRRFLRSDLCLQGGGREGEDQPTPTRSAPRCSGLTWSTPQGDKTIRAGDHQAMQTMYVVQVTDGKFKIIDQVNGEEAIGPDTCKRF